MGNRIAAIARQTGEVLAFVLTAIILTDGWVVPFSGVHAGPLPYDLDGALAFCLALLTAALLFGFSQVTPKPSKLPLSLGLVVDGLITVLVMAFVIFIPDYWDVMTLGHLTTPLGATKIVASSGIVFCILLLLWRVWGRIWLAVTALALLILPLESIGSPDIATIITDFHGWVPFIGVFVAGLSLDFQIDGLHRWHSLALFAITPLPINFCVLRFEKGVRRYLIFAAVAFLWGYGLGFFLSISVVFLGLTFQGDALPDITLYLSTIWLAISVVSILLVRNVVGHQPYVILSIFVCSMFFFDLSRFSEWLPYAFLALYWTAGVYLGRHNSGPADYANRAKRIGMEFCRFTLFLSAFAIIFGGLNYSDILKTLYEANSGDYRFAGSAFAFLALAAWFTFSDRGRIWRQALHTALTAPKQSDAAFGQTNGSAHD